MLNRENLESFTKIHQTDMENVVREYCQHLFLSFLYQQPGCERLLFKGGTALRIVFKSPRFSEDLDFTGVNITQREVENLFTHTLAQAEKTGIKVEIHEGKPTTGGYLGIAVFHAYGMETAIQVEVSLRSLGKITGTRALIQSDYLPPFTLIHLPLEGIIEGKVKALMVRQKPRDFYDYFFMLSGDFPQARNQKTLMHIADLLRHSKINFSSELKKFLPASHAMHLRDFKKVLEQKIMNFGIG